MKVDPTIINILEASSCMGAYLALPEKVDRRTYLKVAEVIKKAGGNWNRTSQSFHFEGLADEAIQPILATGTVLDEKTDLQQFFTPPDLAAELADMAEIDAGMSCCDPSCGDGALLWAMGHMTPSDTLVGYEIQGALAVKAMQRTNASVINTDFLSVAPGPRYDRVVMNPPFSRHQDIAHVVHAAGMLKDGGILVSVMSPTWQTRTNGTSRNFRNWLRQFGGSVSVKELPDGSFKSSGTMASAVVVKIKNG